MDTVWRREAGVCLFEITESEFSEPSVYIGLLGNYPLKKEKIPFFIWLHIYWFIQPEITQ